MLVDGKPPIGFLGGKGYYTDHPYIYQNKKFPLKKQEFEEENDVKTFNIFLAGNSKTRDLVNLQIIDEMNSQLKLTTHIILL